MDVDERNFINSTPFGGVRVIFSGDLWQLDPVCNSHNKLFMAPDPLRDDASQLRGKYLWSLISKGIGLIIV
jgi:hypothetical protein